MVVVARVGGGDNARLAVGVAAGRVSRSARVCACGRREGGGHTLAPHDVAGDGAQMPRERRPHAPLSGAPPVRERRARGGGATAGSGTHAAAAGRARARPKKTEREGPCGSTGRPPPLTDASSGGRRGSPRWSQRGPRDDCRGTPRYEILNVVIGRTAADWPRHRTRATQMVKCMKQYPDNKKTRQTKRR